MKPKKVYGTLLVILKSSTSRYPKVSGWFPAVGKFYFRPLNICVTITTIQLVQARKKFRAKIPEHGADNTFCRRFDRNFQRHAVFKKKKKYTTVKDYK